MYCNSSVHSDSANRPPAGSRGCTSIRYQSPRTGRRARKLLATYVSALCSGAEAPDQNQHKTLTAEPWLLLRRRQPPTELAPRGPTQVRGSDEYPQADRLASVTGRHPAEGLSALRAGKVKKVLYVSTVCC
eukprot:COSAG02_NODE_2844_length_7905_cov_33.004356_5_plen_131_part_00